MNEFFAKSELLAGLSENEQYDLRTNIGLNTLISDMSNTSIMTGSLKVTTSANIQTSNLKINMGAGTSNKFLKSISDDGKATWSALPTYDEMIGASVDDLTGNMFDNLSNLLNLQIHSNLVLQSNLTEPAILTNADPSGKVEWSTIKNDFDEADSRSNVVPSMMALRDLYTFTQLNDSNVYSNLYEVATDTSLVLTTSNNLKELSNNGNEVMSNLGFDTSFTTSNLITSNITASNLETTTLTTSNLTAYDMHSSTFVVQDSLVVHGECSSASLQTSNIVVQNTLESIDISASNLSVGTLTATEITTSNFGAENVTLTNLTFDSVGMSNFDVMIVSDCNLAFKTLTSDFNSSSPTDIPSSKALSQAMEFLDARVQTITTDPTFSETYLQINCNLEEFKFFTVENMLKIHSNLRITKLAREPTWENLLNIPSELLNLSEFYITRDLSNMDLGEFNVQKLRESFQLQDLAYMTKSNVDIRGGEISVLRAETENFILKTLENNLEESRINYRDEKYLFLRHAGDEGENPSGTGKWGNLPIKQHYDDIGENSIPSCKAVSNLYTYMITSNSYEEYEDEEGSNQVRIINGFLNPDFSGQSSQSNAASTKALSDFYDFVRSSEPEDSNGSNAGFLHTTYKDQTSHSNAASSSALSDLHDFIRSSEPGSGFLNSAYTEQTSQSNAATTKALSDMHSYITSSSNGGFLNPFFSNQTSESNAATAKSVTDLYDYIINSFLATDFTEGNEMTAATSASVTSLYEFVRSDEHISTTIDDSNEKKVVSAHTLSNMYYELLANESFLTTHNSYLLNDYLKQSLQEKSTAHPFSSTATSNIIHQMITDPSNIYLSLSNSGLLGDEIDIDDHGIIATSKAIYNLSNATSNNMLNLKEELLSNLTLTETNIALAQRIDVTEADSNPLQIVEVDNSNINISFKYNDQFFKLNDAGEFSLDSSAMSNIASSSIKIRSSQDSGGYSNLIEVDEIVAGEYEIKFKGTSLLDEISGDVAQSVADAILRPRLQGDYTFESNLLVGGDLRVDGAVRASNVSISNVEVASMNLSETLLVRGGAVFTSDLEVHSNLEIRETLTVTGSTTFKSNSEFDGHVNMSDTLLVEGGAVFSSDIQLQSNLDVLGNIVCEDLLCQDLRVNGYARFDNLIEGVADKSDRVLSDKLIDVSQHDKTYSPAAIDIRDNGTYKELRIYSNMTFDSNWNVNMNSDLSVSGSLNSAQLFTSTLSVNEVNFDRLGTNTSIEAGAIQGVVQNASNLFIKRIDDSVDVYNLSMVKYESSHIELQSQSRDVQFGTRMSYTPSENLLSVGSLSANDGYQIAKINASQLSTSAPISLNNLIHITQDNLQSSALSVAHSGISSRVSVDKMDAYDGISDNVTFAQENGTLTSRSNVTYNVVGSNYGLNIGETKVMNQSIRTSELHATSNLTVDGETRFGGHLLPASNDAFDIGSAEYRVRDIFISNNSLWVGDEVKVAFSKGKMKFRKRKTAVVPATILQAGKQAGHETHQVTTQLALEHAGVSEISEMKLQNWHNFMKTFNKHAAITDIFRDDDEDYTESCASDAWIEVDNDHIRTSSHVHVNNDVQISGELHCRSLEQKLHDLQVKISDLEQKLDRLTG